MLYPPTPQEEGRQEDPDCGDYSQGHLLLLFVQQSLPHSPH